MAFGFGFGMPRIFTAPFTPAALFLGGEQGTWYDPSDLTTLFQDSAGTIPVTAVQQPVGLMLDKSKGLVLGPELVTNGDFSNGTTGWTASVGSIAVSSGEMRVTRPAGTASAYESITTVAGRVYKVTGLQRVVTEPAQPNIVARGTSSPITDLVGAGVATSSTTFVENSFYFTAVGSTTFLHLTAGNASGEVAFDNISVKELPGNHAFQTTSASRPVLSARYNLLTKTEQFDDAVWSKFGLQAVSANATIAPNGTLTADRITETSGGGEHYVAEQFSKAAVSQQYTYQVRFKNSSGSRNFAIALTDGVSGGYGAIFSTAGSIISASFSIGSVAGWVMGAATVAADAEGFYVASITVTTNTAARVDTVIYIVSGTSTVYTGDGTSSIFIWGADLRVSNDALSQPAYQRVNTSTDYDTVGFKPYLAFDGVDDSLVTNSIDFTSTDKMTVFAGVRKLSAAAAGIFAELGTNYGTVNGSFALYPNPTGYLYASRGTAIAEASGAATAPTTNVLTGLASISTDVTKLRINGVEAASSTADQGTGNYGNYPLYIGRRGGASLPFNGRLYSLIVRGAASTTAQITSTETYVAGKTGVTLLVPTFDFITTDTGDQIVTDEGDSVITDTYFA